MARIEEALAKVRASAGGVPPRIDKSSASSSPTRNYEGRPIEINISALRPAGLLPPGGHDERFVDQFRAIKRPLLANLLREPKIPRANLVMIGSAVDGEGKTSTALNLCLSLAEEHSSSVVLVDGDCAKRHLTRVLGLQQDRGLTDLLQDPALEFDAVAMPSNIPGLAVLPAGTAYARGAELLASSAVHTLCERLARDPQRLVVFDSGPLLLTADGHALAAEVGQFILVVRANRTLRRHVLQAKELLEPSKAVSILLNGVSERDAGSPYYGYGVYGESRVP